MEYLPSPVDRLVQVGGWNGPNTYALNLNTNTWEVYSGANQGRTGDISAWDPGTGSLWFHSALYAGTDSLMQWNPASHTWTKRGGGDGLEYYMNATVDTKRSKMVAVGGGKIKMWSLTPSGTVAYQELSTTGDTAMVSENNPGLEYDPVTDRIVAWDGGANVYLLNMDTRVWTKVSPASSNTVIPTAANNNGTFGRWRYIPSKNAFIEVSDVNQNVYIYKLSSGSGSVPPPAPSPTPPPPAPSPTPTPLPPPASSATVGISGDKFTINGSPKFLLGASYFNARSWKQSDIDGLAVRGFNNIRIWLETWGAMSSWFFNSDGSLNGVFVKSCG